MVEEQVTTLHKKFVDDLQTTQNLIQTETVKLEQLKGAVYALGLIVEEINKPTDETTTEAEPLPF